ncbi:MAG TPA: N-acetylmuramic acid 6-phosphate etherase [Planctomycetota bacterium]|nr:N-acetylmuramic acid 6-phosphate etherase [Planctomycetota bacterium]
MDLSKLSTEQINPRTATLDQMPLRELLASINREDQSVPLAVAKAIPQIEQVVEAVRLRLKNRGRLFYIGAGTSGRLGCVDASEMPPTYGVPSTLVQGIIAGGPKALLKSQEGAEDDGPAGVRDLKRRKVSSRDAVIGLSASGRARYVQAALEHARRIGAFTTCITCNTNSPLISFAEVAIVVDTGPEVVCGSTRMKAGTAQKLVLNMISTATMVGLGRVKGNRMVDLQIKCQKLQERAERLVMMETGCSAAKAARALKVAKGSVRAAIAWVPRSSRDGGSSAK